VAALAGCRNRGDRGLERFLLLFPRRLYRFFRPLLRHAGEAGGFFVPPPLPELLYFLEEVRERRRLLLDLGASAQAPILLNRRETVIDVAHPLPVLLLVGEFLRRREQHQNHENPAGHHVSLSFLGLPLY
jgi:hypothetical protein